MQSIVRHVRHSSIAGALGLLGLAIGTSACGDDGGGADARPQVDGATPTDGGGIDAGNPADLRSGTIAVLEMGITNPSAPFRGALVSINYFDLSTPSTAPAYGTPVPDLGECVVYTYAVGTDPEPVPVDEGAVTISGSLSPVGTCSFDAARSQYTCGAGSGTASAGSLVRANANGTVTYTFANVSPPFADLDVGGSFAELSGFTNDAFNGRFPVVGQPDEGTIVVTNPGAVGMPPEVVMAGSEPGFEIFAGAGPTPLNRDFLDNGAATIRIEKEDGAVVAAFTSGLQASGQGLVLASDSALPHEMPADAVDVRFSCATMQGGNCGSAGGVFVGLGLSGFTTDADVNALGPTEMPRAESAFATFQCRGTAGGSDVTLPADALAAVLSTSPTRIATQLVRVTTDLTKPQTTVMVGHGLMGFTDR